MAYFQYYPFHSLLGFFEQCCNILLVSSDFIMGIIFSVISYSLFTYRLNSLYTFSDICIFSVQSIDLQPYYGTMWLAKIWKVSTFSPSCLPAEKYVLYQVCRWNSSVSSKATVIIWMTQYCNCLLRWLGESIFFGTPTKTSSKAVFPKQWIVTYQWVVGSFYVALRSGVEGRP